MAKGFGELYKLRGIIYYKLSPFELKAFHGAFSKGFPRTLRRIFDNVPYAGPPLLTAYVIYDQVEKAHAKTLRKNPADYENDK